MISRRPHIEYIGAVSPWAVPENPSKEARFFANLVGGGMMSAAEARELIDVPESIELEWNSIPDPSTRAAIRKILHYRKEVLRHFNRMIQ